MGSTRVYKGRWVCPRTPETPCRFICARLCRLGSSSSFYTLAWSMLWIIAVYTTSRVCLSFDRRGWIAAKCWTSRDTWSIGRRKRRNSFREGPSRPWWYTAAVNRCAWRDSSGRYRCRVSIRSRKRALSPRCVVRLLLSLFVTQLLSSPTIFSFFSLAVPNTN